MQYKKACVFFVVTALLLSGCVSQSNKNTIDPSVKPKVRLVEIIAVIPTKIEKINKKSINSYTINGFEKAHTQSEWTDAVSITYLEDHRIYTSVESRKPCEFEIGTAFVTVRKAKQAKIQPNTSCVGAIP